MLARKKAAPRNEKTKLVWFAVGGSVLGIVSVAAMFMVRVGGGDIPKDPSGADLAAESTNQVPALMQSPFDSSEAQRQQKAWANYLRVPVDIEDQLGMKLILIPPGEFQMGSSAEELRQYLTHATANGGDSNVLLGTYPAETPRHRVRIKRPFYLGIYEVTVQQFREAERLYRIAVSRHFRRVS